MPATSVNIGLSEVGPETIRRAAATREICDLQIEYSVISRGIEQAILPTCEELGIAITAYGVLSRGLISGHFDADRELGPGDFRAHAPRFEGANRERNLALVDALRSARRRTRRDASPRSRSPGCWAAARASSRSWGHEPPSALRESLGSLDVELSAGGGRPAGGGDPARCRRRRALSGPRDGDARQRAMSTAADCRYGCVVGTEDD